MKRTVSFALVLTIVFTLFSFSIPMAAASEEGLDPVADSYIRQGWKYTNYGAENIISVNVTNKDSGLIKYDFSHIPENAVIESAKLVLTTAQKFGSGKTGTVHVSRVLTNWGELDVTYNNFGSYASEPTDSATIAAGAPIGTTVTWDVTADVKAFVNDGVANNGWILTIDWVNNGTLSFYSKESENAPMLVIDYTVPPTPPTSITKGAAADSYLAQGSLSTNFGLSESIMVGVGGGLKQGVVKFDLNDVAVPEGKTMRAELVMITSTKSLNTSVTSISVYRINQAWSEDSVTKKNLTLYADDATDEVVILPNQAVGFTMIWDVTADVEKFLDGSTANNGWLVDMTWVNNGNVSFYSREAAGDNGPKLVITFE